jgi:hypothetical protein
LNNVDFIVAAEKKRAFPGWGAGKKQAVSAGFQAFYNQVREGTAAAGVTLPLKTEVQMTNATPSNSKQRGGAHDGSGERPIKKGAVEARQGSRGRHVLYILAISLALVIVAYLIIFAIHPA